jgi:hypothetical protein
MLTSFSLHHDYGILNRASISLFFIVALLIAPITAFGALKIDGILDEPGWAEAQGSETRNRY